MMTEADHEQVLALFNRVLRPSGPGVAEQIIKRRQAYGFVAWVFDVDPQIVQTIVLRAERRVHKEIMAAELERRRAMN